MYRKENTKIQPHTRWSFRASARNVKIPSVLHTSTGLSRRLFTLTSAITSNWWWQNNWRYGRWRYHSTGDNIPLAIATQRLWSSTLATRSQTPTPSTMYPVQRSRLHTTQQSRLHSTGVLRISNWIPQNDHLILH
jgi:hypothetical protein